MGQPVSTSVMGTTAKAAQLYAELFDWKIDANNPPQYGTVECGERTVSIDGGIGGMPPGMPGHLTFYVEVPDIEAELAQAEQLGGKRIMGPTQLQPGVELGQFSDPEGHMVGLLKGQS
jgi:predicted enzyme related to lactoylglutathione lyase